MGEARWFVGCLLLVSGTGALAAEAGPAAAFGVGTCDEATAIAARSFRTALAAQPGMKVLSEAQTAQPFGGFTERTLAEVSGAIGSARSELYGGQTAQAKTTLQAALDDVTRLAPSDARWAAERDGLTLLAQMLQKSDPKGAEAALNRVFRVEPDYQPDTSNYPPSFQKWADKVRKAAKKKSTARLEVSTSPPGKAVYVGGRKLGVGPASVRVPPGEYRVEADWGHLGAVRTITVPSTPVELSAAVDGAVYPDGGPCVEASDPGPALARMARSTGASRAFGVHPDTSGTDSYMVATSTGPQGLDVREARVKVEPGAPTGDALTLLAGWAVEGVTPVAVEIVKGPGAKPPPVAPVAVAAGATGAATAATPAATPKPAAAPEESSKRDPKATRFEGGLRVAFALPLGPALKAANTGEDVSLSDVDSYSVPIQLDAGVRLGGAWFLGAYFSYGFGGSVSASLCPTGDCSANTMRFGGQVHWHPLGDAAVDPWVGIGSGYEKVSISSGGGSFDLSGWEFGNLQLGVDFAVGSSVKIGPWVGFSVGQYSTGSVSGSDSGASQTIANKTIHEWLMIGVRLVFLP